MYAGTSAGSAPSRLRSTSGTAIGSARSSATCCGSARSGAPPTYPRRSRPDVASSEPRCSWSRASRPRRPARATRSTSSRSRCGSSRRWPRSPASPRSAIVTIRQLASEQRDQETLAALGLNNRQRASAVALLAVPAALGGAAFAVLAALLLSPLLPFGIARKAEVNPGVHVDRLVLGLGFLAIVAFVLVVAAATAWHVARSTGPRPCARRTRPSIGRGACRRASERQPAADDRAADGARARPWPQRRAGPLGVLRCRARHPGHRCRARVRREPRPPRGNTAPVRCALGHRAPGPAATTGVDARGLRRHRPPGGAATAASLRSRPSASRAWRWTATRSPRGGWSRSRVRSTRRSSRAGRLAASGEIVLGLGDARRDRQARRRHRPRAGPGRDPTVARGRPGRVRQPRRPTTPSRSQTAPR